MPRAYGVVVGAAVLTVATVAVLFAVVPSRPAVTSATPPEGAALATAPNAVELVVSQRPDPGRSHLSVVDASGARVQAGALDGVGSDRLRLPVTITGRGTFTVAYHVELVGGGALTGSWRFGVGVEPTDDGAKSAADGADASGAHGHGPDPLSAVLLVVNAVVVLCVAVLLLRRPPPGRARR